MMSMPQLSGSLSSTEREVRAAAAEQLREHLAEVDPDLREGFGEELLRRVVDLRDHVQQLLARIGQVVVLRFEKTITLLEFIVLLDGVEVDRAHVVELAGELGDDRVELGGIDVGRWLGRRALPVRRVASPLASSAGRPRRLSCTRSVFWKA